MSDQCTCPMGLLCGMRLPIIRDPNCPVHGDNAEEATDEG